MCWSSFSIKLKIPNNVLKYNSISPSDVSELFTLSTTLMLSALNEGDELTMPSREELSVDEEELVLLLGVVLSMMFLSV